MKDFTPDELLDTNQAGLDLIKRWEAFRADWYQDSVNVWTIGYGITEKHTPGVSRETLPGPITQAKATRLLKRELIRAYEPAVERLIDVPLTANQFAALVSFCYNVGATNLKRSTLRRKLRRQDYQGAAREFNKWVYADGQKLRGLVQRRADERELFSTPDVAKPNLTVDVEPMEPLQVRPLPYNLPSWITGPLRLA